VAIVELAGFLGPGRPGLLAAMCEGSRPVVEGDEVTVEGEAVSFAARDHAKTQTGHGRLLSICEMSDVIVTFGSGLIHDSADDVRGPSPRTVPDAEVVLRSYLVQGLGCLSGLAGAWTISVVDQRGGAARLVLARGGHGADPVYFARSGPGLLFASSITSILQDGSLPLEVNERRLYEYLDGHKSRNDSNTFFRGIHRLPAGRYLAVNGKDCIPNKEPAPLQIVALPPHEQQEQQDVRRSECGTPAFRGSPVCPSAPQLLTRLPEFIRELEEPLPVEAFLPWHAQPARDARAGPRVGGRDRRLPVEPMESLRVCRAQVQGIFRSPAFGARRYWNGPATAEAFTRACASREPLSARFWRVFTVELWLRVFVDRPREQLHTFMAEGDVEEIGDLGWRATMPTSERPRPHRGHHLAMIGHDGCPYLRIPVRTRNVWPGDVLTEVVLEGVRGCAVPLQPGDVLVIAEKIVAISQGRCVPADQVQVRPMARLLARFVTRTPAGISLRLPQSFEMAIRDVGMTKILAGTVAAALTRPFGVRGVFYSITGWQVAAIDSPDVDALPPSNTHIKLAPHDPEGTADHLAGVITDALDVRVEVAVVDVNDIGAEVLGASRGVDRPLLVSLLRDNPLGQDTQQTPVGIVRRAPVNPAPATQVRR
jgi:hypothetical protein